MVLPTPVGPYTITIEQGDASSIAAVSRSLASRSLGCATVSERNSRVQRYGCLEEKGFVEFSEAIFAVLLTPRETQRSNLRRLESVLRQAMPVNLKRDNSHLIAKIQKELEEDIPASRRAELLREAGRLVSRHG